MEIPRIVLEMDLKLEVDSAARTLQLIYFPRIQHRNKGIVHWHYIRCLVTRKTDSPMVARSTVPAIA